MKKYAIFMGMIIVSLLILSNVGADNDFNDSLDNAETIHQGKTTGEVTTDWMMGDDEDYYIITIPANSKAIIKFKLVSGDSLSVDLFDNEKEEISEFIYLTSPGETETYTRWNQNSDSTIMYIGLSGECSYQIEVSFEELDNNDSIETSDFISSGDTNGEVSYDYDNYEDIDFYSITIPPGDILKIKITMIDGSSISVDGYDSDSSELDSFSMYLSDPGEMETEYVKNSETDDKIIYISLSGEGEYTISVVIEEGDNNDSLETAKPLSTGDTTGDVSREYETYKDVDFYSITIPPGDILTIRVTMIDGSSISVDGYDSDSSELDSFSMYLFNPGEMETEYVKNSETDDKIIYISINGGGKYKVSILILEGDDNDSLDQAEELSEETIVGEVSDDYDYPKDEDYYIIKVPSNTKLTVVAKFEEGNDEYSAITVQGYDHYKVEHNFLIGIWMYLENPGETDSISWINKGTEENVYLGITGDGKYKLTIELYNPQTDDEEVVDDDTVDDYVEPIPHDETENGVCGGVLILVIIGVLLGLLIIFTLIRKKNC